MKEIKIIRRKMPGNTEMNTDKEEENMCGIISLPIPVLSVVNVILMPWNSIMHGVRKNLKCLT